MIEHHKKNSVRENQRLEFFLMVKPLKNSLIKHLEYGQDLIFIYKVNFEDKI